MIEQRVKGGYKRRKGIEAFREGMNNTEGMVA